ncbi:MAG TPA: hypothetical protein VIU46_02195, partial [Gallionellaceae bacterium]
GVLSFLRFSFRCNAAVFDNHDQRSENGEAQKKNCPCQVHRLLLEYKNICMFRLAVIPLSSRARIYQKIPDWNSHVKP